MQAQKKNQKAHAKNVLQGAEKAFIRSLNNNYAEVEIVNMIEEAGVKVMHLCLIRNKETRRFKGLTKLVLVGNNTLSNWMTEKKGSIRRYKVEDGEGEAENMK